MEVALPAKPAFSFEISWNEQIKKKIEEFAQISNTKPLVKEKKEDEHFDKTQHNVFNDVSGTPPGSNVKRKVIPEPIILLGDVSITILLLKVLSKLTFVHEYAVQ